MMMVVGDDDGGGRKRKVVKKWEGEKRDCEKEEEVCVKGISTGKSVLARSRTVGLASIASTSLSSAGENNANRNNDARSDH